MDLVDIQEKFRNGKFDLSLHAHEERQAEQITIEEIGQTLFKGAIIERYSSDPRGKKP